MDFRPIPGLTSEVVMTYEYLCEEEEEDERVPNFRHIEGFTGQAYDIPVDTNKRSCRRKEGAAREAALERCGTWLRRRNPTTGLMGNIQFHCKLKDCPKCGRDRADAYRERVEKAFFKQGVNVLKTSCDAESRAIIGLLNGKRDYLRMPQKDGTEYLFVVPSYQIGNPMTIRDIGGLDWFELQNSPDGRIVSGALGKSATPTEEEDASESFTVSMNVYTIEKDKVAEEAAKLADLETIASTIDMDPHTEQDLQACINKRDRIYENYLTAYGVSYKTERVKASGKLCQINWVNSIGIVLSDLLSCDLVTSDFAIQFRAEHDIIPI